MPLVHLCLFTSKRDWMHIKSHTIYVLGKKASFFIPTAIERSPSRIRTRFSHQSIRKGFLILVSTVHAGLIIVLTGYSLFFFFTGSSFKSPLITLGDWARKRESTCVVWQLPCPQFPESKNNKRGLGE